MEGWARLPEESGGVPDPATPPGETWEPPAPLPPYRPLARRAKVLIGLLVLGVLLDLAGLWSGSLELSLLDDIEKGLPVTEAETLSNDRRQAIVGVAQSVIFTITAAAFIAWLYRGYSNLERLGATELRFSRKWTIGGWFVPILALWRPKQIVNDVWRASDPDAPRKSPLGTADHVPGLFLVWWLAFIFSEWIYNAAAQTSLGADELSEFQSGDRAYFVADLASVVGGVLAILVVRGVTQRQADRVAKQNLIVEELPKPLFRRASTWATAGALVVALGLQILLFAALWRGAISLPAAGSAAPGASSDPGVLVADTFADPGSGWLIEETEGYSMGYSGGFYRISVAIPGDEEHSAIELFTRVQGMSVEVKGWMTQGLIVDGYGIGCWSDTQSGYFAEFQRNGKFKITKDSPEPTENPVLFEDRMLPSRFDRRLNPNVIRFDCTKAGNDDVQLTLWSNGTQIATARDPRPFPSFLGAGIFVSSISGDTDVRFDDFVLREIAPVER